MDERHTRMCLSAICEPGHRAVAAAVAEFGAQQVWDGLVGGDQGPLSRRAQALKPEELWQAAETQGQRFIIPGDAEWPAGFASLAACEPVQNLSGPPLGLWVIGAGHLGELTAGAVAVVGSRASSAYGDTAAAELAAELSDAGHSVISGGAYGIDAAAHRGALSGRTATVAVLAGGLDQPYPAGHARLFDRIRAEGVLISELAPGEHPTRVRFLARNRLIAACASGTVMVEAAARSGARNTVTWATVLGRVVMAVPGPVTSATSVTPHRLIREGEAVLVSSAADILELIEPLGRVSPRAVGEQRPVDELAPLELKVFELVPARGALSAGELALRANLSIPQCLAVMNRLTDAGFVAQDDQGCWRLAASTSRRAGM